MVLYSPYFGKHEPIIFHFEVKNGTYAPSKKKGNDGTFRKIFSLSTLDIF